MVRRNGDGKLAIREGKMVGEVVALNTNKKGEKAEEKSPEMQKFLRFQLGGSDLCLLPTEGVLQVLQIEIEHILPVPQMPGCVMGVYNWRGDLLWLVDFPHLVGLPPLLSEDVNLTSRTTVVVRLNNKLMGLVVDRVEDIEERDLGEMQPLAAGLFSSELLEFLQGYFVTDDLKMLMVFEAEAVLNSPVWQRG
ncbi:MAG: chemotaxis protein CheW [Cyanobacteriota bacterium]|nr:chemotaxis protein CheW [Cyanobacteriota bacterium]